MKVVVILIVALAALLLSGYAAPKRMTWYDTLTTSEKMECEAEGGCMLASVLWLDQKAEEKANAMASIIAADIAGKMCNRRML